MVQQNWREIEKKAKEWIKEAGALILSSFTQELVIETKSNASDLVTHMDRQVEQFFIKKIQAEYPDHYILGEEGYGDTLISSQGTIWLIDPIDGTMNFVHQQRNFAVSIGIYHNGVGKVGLVYDPVHNELYHAVKGEGAFCNEVQIPVLQPSTVAKGVVCVNATWLTPNSYLNHVKMAELVKCARGTRSYGCAALEFVYVATGRVDAYVSPRLSPWDFGGGAVIVEEVGGIASTFEGKMLNIIEKSSVLVARPHVYEEILKHYVS
ncbi:inositol monophosphatase family protein [Bacillus sp. 165]|uniref:inositol monophosphatase family protein n=1 Tax=Bacillus sp. 165 TaxID=1529117 RepID=UPI001AD9735E|nr:inositol monophosphatase family protein [Bacillus sp. 165]MBO9130315.1 inositol monophosphatase family protein [Bacillus sp. 165]